MTTRYTARSRSRFGVPGLPSGYDGIPSDQLVIPSVGIADVDKGLFDLFNAEIPLVVGGDGVETKRVPVVFFAGEKWALNKKLSALKDRNGTLVLPLVTAVRTAVQQDPTTDVTGRGINQQTGELVVRRKLDQGDRGYQALINRMLLPGQSNLAVVVGTGQLTTTRALGDLAQDPVVRQGGLLMSNRLNNVYETIVVPAPQFFTAQYDVTLWAQYTGHMNQMLEALMASFLPQGNCWRLDTPKGYWFIATVDGNSYNADTNTDDYSQSERVIRYKMVVKVQGYILASAVPGTPVPIKRYVSCPTVSFQTAPMMDVNIDDVELVEDPFLGADDPTLPMHAGDTRIRRRSDMRSTQDTLLYPNGDSGPDDPARASLRRGVPAPVYQKVTGFDQGKPVTRLVRVKSTNTFTGETVLSAADMGSMSVVLSGE